MWSYDDSVDEQGIQPLRVVHLGGDEVPKDAWKDSPACRLLRSGPHGGGLQLHFMRLAIDIAAKLGIKTVQVTDDIDISYNNNNNLVGIAYCLLSTMLSTNLHHILYRF